MGFITTINHKTGREVFACEAGMDGCTSYPCRAHYCPFGWCQRYYICKSCWSREDVKKAFSKEGHASCKENVERNRAEEEAVRAGGLTLHFRNGYEREDLMDLYAPTDKWLHGVADLFNTVWITSEQLEELRTLGHKVIVERQPLKV